MHMKGMNRPRLNSAVIEGLRYVLTDAEKMLGERQGWGEPDSRDESEERALLYLRQLLEWVGLANGQFCVPKSLSRVCRRPQRT